MVNPAVFVRQVEQEFKKITWPTRQEAIQMTIVVIVMCVILAGFFCVVDVLSAFIVRLILGIGA